MTNIYFAAPLFNEMEQSFNEHVVKELRDSLGEDISVFSPQEDDSINDKKNFADSLKIYDSDTDKLKDTDILIAILDGQTTDIGVATEVGYFARLAETSDKDKHIIGLYSDTRQGNVTKDKVEYLDEVAESQFSYINLYLIGAIKSHGKVVQSTSELVEVISQLV